jgi:hypothetical protein
MQRRNSSRQEARSPLQVLVTVGKLKAPGEGRRPGPATWVRSIDSYRFGRGGVGLPAGASSAIQVVALRSYLRPFAAFRASLVAFITR